MDENHEIARRSYTGIWILVIVCMGVVIFTLACGAAYTGISQARLTAAKASAGQIESVFYLAERTAADNGLKPASGASDNLLKSYEDTGGTTLSDYDKFVLDTMLSTFGAGRDFDFAVKRFEDGSGSHIQIYYFPVRGHTNLSSDRYYLITDGNITENNSL